MECFVFRKTILTAVLVSFAAAVRVAFVSEVMSP